MGFRPIYTMQEVERLRAQLAEANAKIADLTARLEAQEASEPVAVVRFAGVDKIDRKVLQVNADMLDTLPVGTEVFATPQPKDAEQEQVADGWLEDYITNKVSFTPYEMPGVYFYQGWRHAENHYLQIHRKTNQ